MKAVSRIINIVFALAAAFCANSFALIADNEKNLFYIIPLFLLLNIFSGAVIKTSSKKLRLAYHGAVTLCVFCFSAAVSAVYQIAAAFVIIPGGFMPWLWGVLFCIAAEAIIFWNGMLSVYCSSVQLGIKLRVIGAVCGMIPIVNLIVLSIIIRTVLNEVRFETDKERLDLERAELKLCDTRYPILFVHGVFFRDSRFFNYWGRIPKALEKNGARIFYGEHQSAASVENSAAELFERIKAVTEQTGCKKLNIIAHSKGGLDCRYAIHNLGAGEYVASLTTVNTPHRGCLFADYLLNAIPEDIKNRVASAYNSALKRFGDKNPDFMAAVNNLTAEYCTEFDSNTPVPEGIYCQSIGSRLKKASSGKFPLNFSYHIAKYFDGNNDGLVSESSFKWGEKYTFLEASGKRGISHGDVIDLNRENIPDFDVREFYIKLVNELKNKGL